MVLASLEVAGKIASTIQEVITLLNSLNTSRSVTLQVNNDTNLTLQMVSNEHQHGGFAPPAAPSSQIPPKTADIFGSANVGGSVGTGTQGSVTYNADGLTLVVAWDNPFVGGDSCNADLSGPNTDDFILFHVCGSGDQNAPMRYELHQLPIATDQYIRHLYLDLLNREPDASGLNSFRGRSQGHAASAVLSSQEFCNNTVGFSFYSQLLERQADAGGLESYSNQMQNGVSIQDLEVAILNSDEYKSKHPVPNQFVESLYNKLLGRQSDPGGLQFWIGQINSGVNTADVTKGFLTSREYALQRIKELYQKFLKREADPAGLDFHSTQLQNGDSFQSVIRSFVTSTEYANMS